VREFALKECLLKLYGSRSTEIRLCRSILINHAIYAGALRVGDEIVEICGISVEGRTVDFLQKMLVSICYYLLRRTLCLTKNVILFIFVIRGNLKQSHIHTYMLVKKLFILSKHMILFEILVISFHSGA